MMTSDSSLVYWTRKEICANSIFITTSGSGGDRLLFWHAAPHLPGFGASVAHSNAPPVSSSTSCEVTNRSQSQPRSAEPVTPTSDLTVHTLSEPASNPFALHLISDRQSSHIPNDLSLSPGGGTGTALCVGGIGSGAGKSSNLLTIGTDSDRLVGSVSGPTGSTSAHGRSGASNLGTASSSVTMGAGVSGNPCAPSGTYTHGPGDPVGSAGSDGVLTPTSLIGTNGLTSIEGLPTKLVLSLLHQQFHGVQRKIYIKVGHRVFVGAAFNISPATNVTDDELAENEITTSRAGRSMITFSVVFAMDTAASPSVLSYYTELARLIATQLRRAELITYYLTDQRNLIVSVVDRTSPNVRDTDSGRSDTRSGTGETRGNRESSSSRWSGQPRMMDNPPAPPPTPGGPLPSDWRSHQWSPNASGRVNSGDSKNSLPHSYAVEDITIDQLVQQSSLCAVLKTILYSICLTGHVAVMIDRINPVYFCLPHKAYCLIMAPTADVEDEQPAIRPSAVWRAMDHIRPYHALLLLRRKSDLIDKHLPLDINPSMAEEQTKKPLSERHVTVIDGRHPSFTDTTNPASLWADLPYAKQVELIAWLLRRRLIIQVHIQVLCTLNRDTLARITEASLGTHAIGVDEKTASQNIPSPTQYRRFSSPSELNKWLPTEPSSFDRFEGYHPGSVDQIDLRSSIDPQSPSRISDPVASAAHLQVIEALRELHAHFPPDWCQLATEAILAHPGAATDAPALRLLVRILPRLPANLEELMFVEGVTRTTLIECVERFSPHLLTTVRLPDPATSCFSGVDWPD